MVSRLFLIIFQRSCWCGQQKTWMLQREELRSDPDPRGNMETLFKRVTVLLPLNYDGRNGGRQWSWNPRDQNECQGICGSLPCQVSLPYQNPWPHLVWPVWLLCRHFDMENSWKFQVMPNKPATELQFSYSKIVHRNRRGFPNLHVPVTCETRKWSNSFAFLIWILTNPPANPRLVFFIVDIYQKANISWKTNP